ncbi:hypothetical protein [Streptomyces massasporeus]|uniref:hypothetical protein n=1 Tax=Streptomyces massasporeus TaxID=67324 RepID=UPI0016770FF8|nr:hypothetical protein [Streptomyces massasporeus]GGV91808.1 hypothetical protein GCM10010228_83040 [Streptomyces massasporeus]
MTDQPRGPVDWARQQAAEREQQAATDPRQPAYDAVWAYIRALGVYMPPTTAHRNAVIWRGVHAALDAVTGTGSGERAEATVARVRRLGAELFVDGATHTHRAIGRQILNALQPPEDGETTPADEARLDRAHWEAKYSGDRP